ncbi:enoyl-CoA hydratase-related protein [Rhodocytophaga aerolata]|uniref:Enoyl-CoA hydratase-related protein n=1 Tax=Rhodocytophaga aerolata TaxID=455078 RepID=A0ABT8R4L7_9BACT|nr:enoyl-CoA hydratase-related protein [Rhodocytophaga aerolata]MDO1447032.1 enoyl-CoA hydratase-related protein [Rhodocytophaga aerolata]
MLAFDNINLLIKDSILTVSINRPSKLNALNHKTMEEIGTVMQQVYDSREIKGVIFTGEGEKAFIAGADISEIAALTEVSSRKFAERGQEIFAMIENCPKPVIAAINGYALGGGCELAMACHIRIAVESAKFGQPEVNLGLIPGYGGTQRLTQLVGKGKALELMMTADTISAQEAKAIGLVNHVVPTQAQLLQLAEEILRKILSKAPLAIEMVISCVNAVYNKEEDGYQTEANSFSICCKSEDFKEGTKAFLEKRPAKFQRK